jgi:hypothetical protein
MVVIVSLDTLDTILALCTLVLIIASIYCVFLSKDIKAGARVTEAAIVLAALGFVVNWQMRDWPDVFWTALGVGVYIAFYRQNFLGNGK